MIFTEQKIKGVWVIEPKVFYDERGYFMESYKGNLFEQHIGRVNFIQDNESSSTHGVLRGLHYQSGEFSQAKLVRALHGRVLDVVVDMRRSSPYFGQHVAVELSDKNKKQLYVPRGFAHGFVVLSESAVFSYKVDNVYMPDRQGSILWSDSELGIDWMLSEDEIILSEKDKAGALFQDTPMYE